jgi:hypothetical protein
VLVEVDEVEVATEPAVVAALRLLDPRQVVLEILRVEERRAVHARQLRLRLVPAPVGAGEGKQLHGPDRRRVLEVRPAAEVDEVALLVDGDVAVGRVHELDLVRLACLLEVGARLVPAGLPALPGAALGDLAADLLLQALERLLGHRLRELEVVVEPVLDRRADRHLRPGVQASRGLGEQVRGRMAEHVERVGVFSVARRQDLDPLAVGERQAQVAHGAVRAHEDRLLGQLRPDRARGVEPARAVGELELRLVWKDHPHGDREY